MPFGLKNATQTWQRFIDEILKGLSFCFAHLDDILVFSPNVQVHEQHLHQVRNRLSDHGVVLNHDKCIIKQAEITFLGHIVSAEGVMPNAEKIATIQSLPKPSTYRELRQYLGMINFYRRHLPGTAKVQVPLTDALAGHEATGRRLVNWTSEMNKAFNDLQASLSRAVLLAHPVPYAQLAIVVDASQVAIGAALQQRVQEHWQPLKFFSQKLQPAQQ